MDEPTSTLEQRLVADRPRWGGALDDLRARVLASVAGRGPRRVGRYRLGRVIGSGAYGQVYEADDPELQRKVAIKLFSPSAAAQRERVLREARMLATVSSPNVVHVFEVGTLDEVGNAPYLVMELVEGPTLRAHLADAERPWRESVVLMIAAARGLAAAHARGVVHRDFKPDNVILASDGRPRVVDFGLARVVGEGEDAPSIPQGSPMLTPAGHVLGTPAYMAPEAFTGPCTPATDQYSVCVTLYEALFGTRPFHARTTEELVNRLTREDPTVPRARQGVPPAVIAAVMRGLRRDPARRHADLDALVLALERAIAPRPTVLSIGLGVVAIAGVLAIAGSGSASRACTSSAAIWTRTQPHDARLAQRQAAYASRWQSAERALCEASGDALTDAQRHCLDRRLDEVAAVGELLDGLAADARAELDDPYAELPAPDECAEPPSVEAAAHVVVDAAAVARIEAALARLRAHMSLAQPAEGLALSIELLADARAIDYAPLVVEVGYTQARLLLLTSQFDEAVDAFEQTFNAAQAAGLDRDAAHAASELLRAHAWFTGDLRAARRFAEHAQTSFARAGIDPLEHGVYADGLAALLQREGDAEDAAQVLREAIAKAELRDARPAGMTGGLYNRLGVVLIALDRTAEAAEASAKAAEIFAATNGDASPPRASALDNEGLALVSLDRLDEALALHREALAIREATLAPDHVDLAASLGNMAEVLERLGRADEAAPYIERALAIFEARLGPDHPHVAIGLGIRGRIRSHGDADARARAREDFARAQRIYAAVGDDEQATAMGRAADEVQG